MVFIFFKTQNMVNFDSRILIKIKQTLTLKPRFKHFSVVLMEMEAKGQTHKLCVLCICTTYT